MSDLQFIMERVKPGGRPDCFRMWACRGEGKGCARNKYRNAKKHCDDCVPARDEETLGELQKRIAAGDA